MYLWEENNCMEARAIHPTTNMITEWCMKIKNKNKNFIVRKLTQFITASFWIINHFELKEGEEGEYDHLINAYFRSRKFNPIEKNSKEYGDIERNLEVIYSIPPTKAIDKKI